MPGVNLRSFVDGLQATGLRPPALVVVEDYRHRVELAGALRDEADIHGVNRAHWHMGKDPDAPAAEDEDPRLASLVLDPVAVVDILVETFFPGGPEDVLEPGEPAGS